MASLSPFVRFGFFLDGFFFFRVPELEVRTRVSRAKGFRQSDHLINRIEQLLPAKLFHGVCKDTYHKTIVNAVFGI